MLRVSNSSAQRQVEVPQVLARPVVPVPGHGADTAGSGRPWTSSSSGIRRASRSESWAVWVPAPLNQVNRRTTATRPPPARTCRGSDMSPQDHDRDLVGAHQPQVAMQPPEAVLGHRLPARPWPGRARRTTAVEAGRSRATGPAATSCRSRVCATTGAKAGPNRCDDFVRGGPEQGVDRIGVKRIAARHADDQVAIGRDQAATRCPRTRPDSPRVRGCCSRAASAAAARGTAPGRRDRTRRRRCRCRRRA